MTYSDRIRLDTQGFSDIVDITREVKRIITESGLKSGIVTISAIGSTASVTTIEFEPALVEDFREKLQQLFPSTERRRHSETWGDDNGFSHPRASFMGPALTLPVSGGEVVLGTWQQIVFIDHDNRPRSRELFVLLVGET
ncbi:MAG TPA: YjbQ family protein [Chlorobaculum parvum]|uniref:YjbQ family protein n=1 Tax=Chlorobaculum parvum TaxID=274539 RepID=A0A7C5HQA5_9CHLB|nr:YjbQ family protein [Chlorobaculum parvum]